MFSTINSNYLGCLPGILSLHMGSIKCERDVAWIAVSRHIVFGNIVCVCDTKQTKRGKMHSKQENCDIK